MSAAGAYLLAYNAIQLLGWTYILIAACLELPEAKKNEDLSNMWYAVKTPMRIFQTLMLLEVIHALVGIVRSSAWNNLLQVGGRCYVMWLIYQQILDRFGRIGTNTPAVALLTFPWAITEILRYSYYILYVFNVVPYWLTWCRYSFFTIMYPLGVTVSAGLKIPKFCFDSKPSSTVRTFVVSNFGVLKSPNVELPPRAVYLSTPMSHGTVQQSRSKIFHKQGEVLSIWRAASYLQKTPMFRDITSFSVAGQKFQLSWLLYASLGLYLIFFPKLYTHMFKQREKVLGRLSPSSSSSSTSASIEASKARTRKEKSTKAQ